MADLELSGDTMAALAAVLAAQGKLDDKSPSSLSEIRSIFAKNRGDDVSSDDDDNEDESSEGEGEGKEPEDEEAAEKRRAAAIAYGKHRSSNCTSLSH